MQPEFWHDRWRIGADRLSSIRGRPASVKPLADARTCRRRSRVFVPLCGKSLDLLWLRERGHAVIGVELSRHRAGSVLHGERHSGHGAVCSREFDVYEADGLQLFRGDFFALDAALLGSVAAVYDRAALISWTPETAGARTSST